VYWSHRPLRLKAATWSGGACARKSRAPQKQGSGDSARQKYGFWMLPCSPRSMRTGASPPHAAATSPNDDLRAQRQIVLYNLCLQVDLQINTRAGVPVHLRAQKYLPFYLVLPEKCVMVRVWCCWSACALASARSGRCLALERELYAQA